VIVITRSTFYGEGVMVPNEDLSEIERAGRRCGVCRSGRGWRRFEVVRPAGRDPVVVCGGCRARLGDDLSIGRPPAPDLKQRLEQAQSPPSPVQPDGERQDVQRPDRLRVAMGKMSGSFSTAMIARESGLNNEKALARLLELERGGEVRRIGKRWTAEAPPSDIAAALDRLAARTSNLRIIREPARVG
jgi:hypothetical protein